MEFTEQYRVSLRPVEDSGFVDEHGQFFEEAAGRPGYIRASDVSRLLLGEQGEYGNRCLDGGFGEPELGGGLDYIGSSEEDPRQMAIRVEDVQEFVQRFMAHEIVFGGLTRQVIDGRRVMRRSEEQELVAARKFLADHGFPLHRPISR